MKVTLQIEGIKCEGCVERIYNIIKQMKGVRTFKLNQETNCLVLDITKEKVLIQIREQLEVLGFLTKVV